MIGKENDVCIRLVEYSKNGRVFRKWSYERLGERVKDTKWQDPSCPCDMADRITEENELKEKDHRHERSSGSPLARTLKQQRVVRQERDMEKEEEAITNILKMQAEMERKREVKIKRDKQKFEQRFDQFDKRNKADSYNEITYQPTRKDFKVRRSRTSGTSVGGDQPVTWEKSCDLKIERHSDQEDTKEHLVIHRRHRKTHSKPHHVHNKVVFSSTSKFEPANFGWNSNGQTHDIAMRTRTRRTSPTSTFPQLCNEPGFQDPNRRALPK